MLMQRLQVKMLNEARPRKQSIPYRYDPPVLMLVMTWHETQAKFGQFLHDRLAFSYFNNTEFVGLCPPIID